MRTLPILLMLAPCAFLAEAPLLAAAPLPAPQASVADQIAAAREAIAEGRAEEALALADAIEASDAPAAAYVAGLAFHRMAQDGMARGTGMVAIQLDDALSQLGKAVAADPARFPDAYAVMAECAWYGQELETGREAGEKAVELRPLVWDGWFWLGRVAFSQFSAAQGDESREAEAQAHLARATQAFDRAAQLLGDPADPGQRTQLGQVLLQAGHAHAWREELAEADAAYARSLGYDPTQVDFGTLLSVRGEGPFLAILEDGHRQFTARYGADTVSDAGLLWWLGWARLRQEDHEGAEEALLASVAKWPAYANAYYYVAHSRFQRGDYPGAIEAFKEHGARDHEGLVAQLAGGGDLDFDILGFLTGICARARPARNVDAAWLSELRAALRPEDHTTWNDVGLFHRDAGDALRRSRDESKVAERDRHYEQSYAAYLRALELAPDDPAYLNDAAVVLHYCLVRDLDEAARMYRRSTERAEEELARTDLSDEERELYRIALRDSRDNLEKLEKLQRERAKPPEAPAEGPAEGDEDGENGEG